jgi:tyrosyl-tRNA synthetase
LRAIHLENLLKAGVHFKLWVADWFAWLNDKFGGDLERIQTAGKYLVEAWKACGVDTKKVKVLWTSDAVKDQEYWKGVITVAKNVTLARAQRAISIMGRTMGELKQTAWLIYPMMQVRDVFWLDCDMTQLGMDQRRANILAREVAEKLKWKKPVVVSHHMLMGLQGIKQPEGLDENKAIDIEISSKMSKSKPETAIFIHDSEETIKRKIAGAFCEPKNIESNPVLEICKYIIFKKMKELHVDRLKKFGGPITYYSYADLEKDFSLGNLHPADLKNAVAAALEKIIAPVREHFEKNKKARKIYEIVKQFEVTR